MSDFSINNDMMPKFNQIGMPKLNNPLEESLSGQISKDINLSNDKELISDLNKILGTEKIQKTTDIENISNTFAETLGNHLKATNEKHEDAMNAIQTFASGGDIDIHTVMIAQEKANLSMQLTMQMRNKVLQAYNEIKQIRV